eukprot:TRINITY_DN12821_c0_g1_i2.p1 TRINITY_DN12821_c0_g1~~TRINITY_DN12821_c0_g1_i2.p1  ORF type:complete len:494 (-),score=95.72 TRINITY_DN12821_c0_g1_i2:674-2155(-)
MKMRKDLEWKSEELDKTVKWFIERDSKVKETERLRKVSRSPFPILNTCWKKEERIVVSLPPLSPESSSGSLSRFDTPSLQSGLLLKSSPFIPTSLSVRGSYSDLTNQEATWSPSFQFRSNLFNLESTGKYLEDEVSGKCTGDPSATTKVTSEMLCVFSPTSSFAEVSAGRLSQGGLCPSSIEEQGKLPLLSFEEDGSGVLLKDLVGKECFGEFLCKPTVKPNSTATGFSSRDPLLQDVGLEFSLLDEMKNLWSGDWEGDPGSPSKDTDLPKAGKGKTFFPSPSSILKLIERELETNSAFMNEDILGYSRVLQMDESKQRSIGTYKSSQTTTTNQEALGEKEKEEVEVTKPYFNKFSASLSDDSSNFVTFLPPKEDFVDFNCLEKFKFDLSFEMDGIVKVFMPSNFKIAHLPRVVVLLRFYPPRAVGMRCLMIFWTPFSYSILLKGNKGRKFLLFLELVRILAEEELKMVMAIDRRSWSRPEVLVVQALVSILI